MMMTKNELYVVQAVVRLANDIVKSAQPYDGELHAATEVARLIIEREINLRTLDPVRGTHDRDNEPKSH